LGEGGEQRPVTDSNKINQQIQPFPEMESDPPTDYDQRVNRKAAGYSLLEMMTVVLLILIVASISMPAYQTVRVRARG